MASAGVEPFDRFPFPSARETTTVIVTSAIAVVVTWRASSDCLWRYSGWQRAIASQDAGHRAAGGMLLCQLCVSFSSSDPSVSVTLGIISNFCLTNCQFFSFCLERTSIFTFRFDQSPMPINSVLTPFSLLHLLHRNSSFSLSNIGIYDRSHGYRRRRYIDAWFADGNDFSLCSVHLCMRIKSSSITDSLVDDLTVSVFRIPAQLSHSQLVPDEAKFVDYRHRTQQRPKISRTATLPKRYIPNLARLNGLATKNVTNVCSILVARKIAASPLKTKHRNVNFL